MQIPILNGIYTDENSDFRASYPVNMTVVPKVTGVSSAYLRPAEGIVESSSSPGIGRGGINWLGVCYRVMGERLIKVNTDGTYTELAIVPGSDQVRMYYSFDYLGIAADKKLYLWDGVTIQQVTDADLGVVDDMLWVDGYWMTTDGVSLVVTDLNNPFAVNPFKYGSSEADPDPIKAILKIKNEPHALNRHTIEVFDNIGGELFPFQRIKGAQIEKGTVGRDSCCVLEEAIAFLGNGVNEKPAIYRGLNGAVQKISTREIDQVIGSFTEEQLSTVLLETRVEDSHSFLYVHFPDQTWVYDAKASSEQLVWVKRVSGIQGDAVYRAKNFVWCYDKWLCEDPLSARFGYLTKSISSHYGETIYNEFSTQIIYNQAKGAIFKTLELICLTGRVALGKNPVISTTYSTDGVTFSQEMEISAGKIGQRDKRIQWRTQGRMRKTRIQKFRFTSDVLLTVSALEAEFEPLYA